MSERVRGRGDFWDEVEVQLMPGEEILYAGRPDVAKISAAQVLGWCVASVFFMGMTLFFLPLVWWMGRVAAQRHQYCVTNQRVVVTDGLIGYRTRSVPLERISDVQIGCTWIERSVGIRSIVVRDMTGEAQGGATMQGLTDPSAVQSLILQEVARVNAAAPTGTAGTTSAAAPETSSEEVVQLLREIRDALVHRG